MVHLTQLLYVKAGKEAVFQAFERGALRLMEKYGGQVHYRVRPGAEAFIEAKDGSLPYEIHLLSFPSEQALQDYLADEERERLLPLKVESVESIFLTRGVEI